MTPYGTVNNEYIFYILNSIDPFKSSLNTIVNIYLIKNVIIKNPFNIATH